jgi:hypothetical protein
MSRSRYAAQAVLRVHDFKTKEPDRPEQEGDSRTMIGLRRTYQDVAREISEGLSSGHVILKNDSTQDEMGFLAALFFRHLAPKKVAFVVGASASTGGFSEENSRIMIQLDPENYENLPEEVKASLNLKTRELIEKGVKFKVKDLEGKTIDISRFINMNRDTAIRPSSVR